MKDSKQLMDMVFEEVDIDNVDIVAAGEEIDMSAVPAGINVCAWMSFMCLHNVMVPGSGGGTSIDACDWVKKHC